VAVEVDFGEVVTCGDPSARDEQVFDRIFLGDPNYVLQNDVLVQGLVVDDITGDGFIDIFVPHRSNPPWFFVGDGAGGFTPTDPALEVTSTAPPSIVRPGGHNADYYGLSVSSVDMEGDGDRDIIVSQALGEPTLYLNDGSGALAAGVPFRPGGDELKSCGGPASFADYDLDGDLDLFFSRTMDINKVPCGSRFYETDAGDFVERSELVEIGAREVIAVVAAFLPLDTDPWPEILLGNIQPGLDNRVADLQGSEWKYEPGAHPLDTTISTMGLGTADLNLDGYIDIFVPGTREFNLHVSEGPDLWVDQARAVGLWPDASLGHEVAWAGQFADLDADGLLDLPVTYDPVNVLANPTQPDAIYRQVEEWTWEDVAPEWGWNDIDPARTAVAIDLDGNGFLDLVKRQESHVVVDFARCNTNGWLAVRLEQDSPNRDAVGAEVVVWSNGYPHKRWIAVGTRSFAVGLPQEEYIGLGATDQIDGIDILWPDQSVSSVGPLTGRRAITIRRVEGP
jgi:hypothetical protein